MYNSKLLNLDAVNRAVRTFLQALFLEVLIQVGPYLNAVLQDEDTRYDANFLQSLVRVIGMASLAYVMRRFLDPSKLPTPLPPEHPGRPADDVDGNGSVGGSVL